jgi:hypothetical protein
MACSKTLIDYLTAMDENKFEDAITVCRHQIKPKLI